MTKRAPLLAVLCVSAAVQAEGESVTARPARPTRGVNVTISGLFGSDRDSRPTGFLLAGGIQLPAGTLADTNIGVSFERLMTPFGPVVAASAIEVTAERNAFCDGNGTLQCPAGEQQTFLTARLGLRL